MAFLRGRGAPACGSQAGGGDSTGGQGGIPEDWTLGSGQGLRFLYTPEWGLWQCGYFDYWGHGTTVTVSSGCRTPEEGNTIGLACLARGYFPESVKVTPISGKQDQTEKTSFTLKAPDNAELSFLTAQWKPGPFQCSTASGDVQKAFRWPASWEAKVPPPTPGRSLSEDFTRLPSTARVSAEAAGQTENLPPRAAPSQARATTSPNTMKALAPRRGTDQETECRNHTSPPSLYLPRPPLQGPWLQGQATFTCLAVGTDLQEARLSWEVAGAPLHEGVDDGPLEKHANGSQSRSSRLDLPVSSWASGASITCTLSSPGVPSHVVSAAPRKHAASAPSSLTVRVLTVSRAASWLLCKVSGFSPPDVLLTWLKGRVQVEPGLFATATPLAEPGNSTFEAWSILQVPTAQAPRLDTYVCVVRHEASRRLLNASWTPDTAGLAMTPLGPESHDESRGDSVDLEDTGRLWPTFAALFLLTLLYSGFVTFIKVK